MNYTSDALTNFVDQLNVFPTFPTWQARRVKHLSGQTWCRTQCQHVLLIHSMGNRLFCLSRKLMDPAVVLWHVEC